MRVFLTMYLGFMAANARVPELKSTTVVDHTKFDCAMLQLQFMQLFNF